MNPIIAAMIIHSGRSWWQARFSDGGVLSECDTLTDKIRLPLGIGRSSQWENINKDGMIGLRLLCPNGQAGELEAPEGHKFFQLKAGGMDIGFGGTKGGRYCDAHIIGVVKDASGSCFCRAWEMRKRRLVEFYDNVFNMKYRQIGPLSLDVQGIKI
jgi:hypothetical protein